MKKSGIKKHLLTLSAAAMLVLFNQTPANAENAEYYVSDEILQAGGFPDESGKIDEYGQIAVQRYLGSAQVVPVEQAIYDGLVLGSETIDISSYYIAAADLKDVYVSVLNNNADLFYVDGRFSYYNSNGYVTKIIPSYNMSEDDRKSARAEFNREIETIMSQADEGWSDLEKALFYHDYMCTHFEYDTTYTISDAYNMLTKKKGVCQGYALLYNYLLKQEGIQGSFASSDAMNHIWNIISINGNWYHVDVTWDDPVADAVGRSGHNNFLRSDEGIASGHHDWTADYKCTSTAYETAFWNTINSPIVWENSQWYCINTAASTINECDVNSVSLGKEVYFFTSKWYTADGTGYWSGTYSGLGSYNGKIYFNTPSDIYSYDTSDGQVTRVYTPVLSDNQKLYGLYLDQNVIKYTTALSPNEARIVKGTYTLPEKPAEPELDISVTVDTAKGNVVCAGGTVTPAKLKTYFKSQVTVSSGSAVIGSTDAAATGYTATVGNAVYTIVIKGDVNGDGEITVIDMEAIQKDILKLNVLSGAYLEAGKLNKISTSSLSVLDMEIIQKYILGLGDIS